MSRPGPRYAVDLGMGPVEVELADIMPLVSVIVLIGRLREQRLEKDLELLLPPTVLPTATRLYWIPVRHVEGIEHPMLAHVVPLRVER